MEKPILDPKYRSILDKDMRGQIWLAAQIFAQSEMVPERFQTKQGGRDKTADCFVVIDLAMRLGIDVYLAFQQCYVVQGQPGMGGQLVISLANRSDAINGRIHFEMTGEGASLACRAYATDDTGAEIECTVPLSMAAKSGWKSQLWKSNPELMLKYRSATYLVRTHCPEVLCGMPTDDELRDIVGAAATETPPPTTLSELTERLTAPEEVVVDEPADDMPDPEVTMAAFKTAYEVATTIAAVEGIDEEAHTYIKSLGGEQHKYALDRDLWSKTAFDRIADAGQ